jgi:BirA family biotin operon repressor/biotin-[acetyl-CoA-carboxylase] ligase
MTTLDPEALRSALDGRWGTSVTVVESTSSTMDDAAAAAADGAPDGHVIVADRQDHGRGAHGRSWESPGGTDLYFSIVARPTLEPSSIALVTLATGLGVRDAVASFLPDRAIEVKWPNDVWVERRKCAGVLVESRMTGPTIDFVILGVGLNVNRLEWPAELEGIATSILQEGGGDVLDRVDVLASVIGHIESRVDGLVNHGSGALVDALRPHLALVGDRVRWEDGEGVFEGVDAGGAALVRTNSKLQTLHAARFQPLD